MTEIAVYVEGGGGTVALQGELRRGFNVLFKGEVDRAREKKLGIQFTFCGGRDEAYGAFIDALQKNPQRVNALLVDSETAIASVPKDKAGKIDKAQDALVRVRHLRQPQGPGPGGQGDGWELSDDLAERVHLMVQCMETWIVADPDALEAFYKQNFKSKRLPERLNLEEESKADIYAKLEDATEGTQKGRYAKIRHASQLLAVIDPEKIAGRCLRFSIFRDWLAAAIEGAPIK